MNNRFLFLPLWSLIQYGITSFETKERIEKPHKNFYYHLVLCLVFLVLFRTIDFCCVIEKFLGFHTHHNHLDVEGLGVDFFDMALLILTSTILLVKFGFFESKYKVYCEDHEVLEIKTRGFLAPILVAFLIRTSNNQINTFIYAITPLAIFWLATEIYVYWCKNNSSNTDLKNQLNSMYSCENFLSLRNSFNVWPIFCIFYSVTSYFSIDLPVYLLLAYGIFLSVNFIIEDLRREDNLIKTILNVLMLIRSALLFKLLANPETVLTKLIWYHQYEELAEVIGSFQRYFCSEGFNRGVLFNDFIDSFKDLSIVIFITSHIIEHLGPILFFRDLLSGSIFTVYSLFVYTVSVFYRKFQELKSIKNEDFFEQTVVREE